MLCTRLESPDRLDGRPYVAEPKLDGQRAQVHVARGRTAHVYSRPGCELLRRAGMAWLRELRWPVDSAMQDGEAVAGDGHEGIQSVLEARGTVGSAMAMVLFELLQRLRPERDAQAVAGSPEAAGGSRQWRHDTAERPRRSRACSRFRVADKASAPADGRCGGSAR